MDCDSIIAKVMSELEQGIVNLDQLKLMKEALLKIEEQEEKGKTATMTDGQDVIEEIDILEGAAERLANLVGK